MPRIRKVEIKHFRSIQELSWCPAAGINCLIGPGDSGKSSILEAIDFCLGARRNIQFTDADFHQLDVETPITILVTLGDLDERLKNLDAYGVYLRSFDGKTAEIEDEPEKDTETVLTIKLVVESDLEPSWTLVSARAEAQGMARNLNWSDRVRIAPTRMGVMADYHLGWRRGSVLNRVSEERIDASVALAKAARDARAAFGEDAQGQLGTTLGIVAQTAKDLGIPIGKVVKAMLDAHTVSFSGGTISLHDEDGVPLRGLGTGSIRLLIAGLQRKAAAQSVIIMIDELEYGLEPHRIIRLLGSLGAKETKPPLQVFMTTHSPVALRELAGNQLFIVRPWPNKHEVLTVGTADEIQSTIRSYPDAFLAQSVIICEGASEVGLLRGLDQHRTANGQNSITAQGTSFVDCGGGGTDRLFQRAATFHALGYRTAIVRDNDQEPDQSLETAFTAAGGKVFTWREGRALEDELFLSLTDNAASKLIDYAIEVHGDDLINQHIKTVSDNKKDLDTVQTESLVDGITEESRQILSKSAKVKRQGWFKSVTWMEKVGRDIVGPDLSKADIGMRAVIEAVFAWASDAEA